MTCIVGLKHNGKVWIGGDSAGVAGLSITVRKDPKVFVREKVVIGFTTSFRMGQLLMQKLRVPKRHADTDPFEYMITDFIEADRTRVEQMFLNLLKNAREAMPHGGTITVQTRLNGNTYEIEFADTGHGMNETTRRSVFYPFYTTKPNGTGLGLMLTKTIAEEARGTVSCRSQLGSGTTFTLQFPA